MAIIANDTGSGTKWVSQPETERVYRENGLKIRFQLIWSLAAARLISIRGVIQKDDKSDWHQCGCT